MPSYLSLHTSSCSSTHSERRKRFFLPLAAFHLPHENLFLGAGVLGEDGRRTASVFLTERRANSAPSSAAAAAGARGGAHGKTPLRSPPALATLPAAPHRKGLDQPLSRRSGGRPATSPHHRALARPYGCFKRLSPGPRRPACPQARARQPRTPRPASPPLPPRGGAAVERVGRRHRAYGCLGSRGLGHPSRLGHSPVLHCRHTALFTRAAGEVPAVS